jgi:hypothetical protein
MLGLPFLNEETGGSGLVHVQERISGQSAPGRKVVNGRATVGDDFEDRPHRQRPDRPHEADQEVRARSLAGIEDVVGLRQRAGAGCFRHIALPRLM